MLYDRFGNLLKTSLFPEQSIITQASTESKARAYLENIENQMKVQANGNVQNPEQGILVREAQRREQERLNRINPNVQGYNKHGYPEVLPVDIRQIVANQALGADTFAQTQAERANSLLNASLDSTEQLASETKAGADRYPQSQHPQNQPKVDEWDFVDDWQDTPEAFAESASKTPTNNYGQRKMQMPQMPKDLPFTILDGIKYPLGAGALYAANALNSGGNERWDRTAENTVGNLAGSLGGAKAGAILGSKLGGYGAIAGGAIGSIAGGLGGGFVSDRIADAFDPTMGMSNEALALEAEEKKQAALTLLNQYLDPRAQAALQQRLMQHQMVQAQ